MSKRKKVISDSLFLYASHFLDKARGLFLIPILIKTVGIESYAVFIQILVNIQMLIPFTSLAMGQSFYRYTSKLDDSDTDSLGIEFWTVFLTSFFLSLFGAIFLFLLSPIISHYILHDLGLKALRLSSFLLITRTVYGVLSKFLEARKRFKSYSILSSIFHILPILGLTLGVFLYKDIVTGVLFYVLCEMLLITFLFSMILLRWDFPFKFIDVHVLKKFLKYSAPLIPSSISTGILSKIDRYFIGYFLGPASMGIYNIVYSVCSLVDSYTFPFNKYYQTYLPKIWDSGKQKGALRQLKIGSAYYLILAIGSILGLMIVFDPMVVLVLHKDIPIIINPELTILIVGLGILINGFNRFNFKLVKLEEKNYYILLADGIAASANIILNFFLIPVYGILGAAFATLISYSIISILLNSKYSIGIDYLYIKNVAKITLASMSILILLLFDIFIIDSYLKLVAVILLGTLFYSIGLFALKVFSLHDVLMFFKNR